MNEWLNDPHNQTFLYAVCHTSIVNMALEEEPIFEEIFPQYMDLARRGEVRVGTVEDNAFGFAGEGELLTLILIPAAILLLGALLANHSAKRFEEIQKLSESELRDNADIVFDNSKDPQLDQAWIRNSLLKSVLNKLDSTE